MSESVILIRRSPEFISGSISESPVEIKNNMKKILKQVPDESVP